MGGKSAQSTQSVAIPPQILAQYASVNSQAQATAATPFQSYGTPGATNADGTTQQFVAPVNQTQQTGIAGTTAAANEAQPGYTSAQNTLGTAQAGTTGINNAATGLAAASSEAVDPTQLTGADVNQYLSPYLGDVLGTTNALANQNNAQAQSGALGTAISSGAFGSDRTGIAAANLNQQQGLAEQATDANILNTGYNTALGTAQQQQGVNLSAGQANRAALASSGSELASIGQTAYGEGANTASEQGALASGAQTAGLQGANAEIAAGTVQQQTAQAADTAEYNQFLQQQSYPFQVDQFLANIAEGTGALSGSTTTTTQPGGFFSDRRLKHDIKKIGETFDKQTIYSYKMHGDDRTHIGLMAQDVEKKRPEAVGLARGYKIVDYGAATEAAANRGHFFEGGVVPMRRAKAGGGPSIVDAGDLQAILAAQQGMYAPMAQASGVYGGAGGSVPRGGSSRVPAPEGAVPHLVTAQGSLKQQPTGVQNLASAANLYKEGKGIYDDTQKPVRHTTTTTTPGGVAPAATGAWSDPGANFDGSAANVAPDTTEASVPYRRGGVAGARRGYDDGGGVDFDSLAAAHGAMYGQGSSRPGEDIPSGGGGSHQLAVASGSPQPAPSGASNLNQGLGLVQKGQQIYNKMSGPSAPPSSTPDLGSGLGSGAQTASAPAADSSTISGIASPAAAPAADAGATSAAAGAGSGAAAGAAGDAAAGAAGAAAADAGGTAAAEAAAAIAAEYAAADVGTVALLAAKRGGRIGYDAGGMPYSSDDGSLDIPDTSSGASALKTAGPLQKQPTGLQTLETLGTEQGAQGAISGMFSNQALKRGGVAGARRGYADGGDPTDDTDNTDAGPSTAAPVADAPSGVAAAAKPEKLSVDSGPSWWDRNKGKAIPLLEGLAAMGTAPTKHLGVALAAGLGAGAGAYVPTNQGLASTRQTEAETQGKSIQNQMSQQTLDLYKQSIAGMNKPTAPTPTAPKSTGITPLSVDDATGYYQDKYKFNPNITPQAAANVANLRNVDAMAHTNLASGAQFQAENNVKQGAFTAQNAAQRDYDKLNLGVVHAGDNGDSAYTNLKQINPGLAAQVAVKAGLDPANQDTWKPDEIKNADKFAAQAAAQHMALIHQYTGSDYKGDNAVDPRTNVPAPGPAQGQLTPEQRSTRQLHGLDTVTLGAGLPQTKNSLMGNGAPPGPAGSSPATVPPPARTPPRAPGTAAPGAAPQIAAPPQDPVLSKALADQNYNIPAIPTPTDQVSLQAAKDRQKATSDKRQQLLDDSETTAQSASAALQFAQAAKAIMDSKGAPLTGPLGPAAKSVTSLFGGVNATNYQEVAKYLGNLSVQSGKSNFSHTTDQNTSLQFEQLNPSTANTEDALKALLDSNIRTNQYTLDTANRVKAYDAKNKDPQNFFKWNQKYFPRADAVNPVDRTPTVTTKADYDALPKGATYIHNGKSGVKQ